MLPFRALEELEPLVGSVRRAWLPAFKRIQPELLTRRERQMRTEKLQGGSLILNHSLFCDSGQNRKNVPTLKLSFEAFFRSVGHFF